jgi:DNA repair exonuclease SbcCD ATPase subunit
MTTTTGLRIVRLSAENVKRLRAVDITPDGDTVVIAGRNGQGKTSVLDSIVFALAGTGAQRETPRPIREGENHASVVLDLGDLTVRREWKGDKQALTVTAADGAKYGSPQKMLDAIIGRLSFDPLAFSQLPDKAQLEQLLELVELPFDPAELDAERKSVFDERTDVNRQGKQLAGQLAGMPEPDADLPADEVSISDLLAEQRDAQAHHRHYAEDVAELKGAHADVEEKRRALEAAKQALATAEADLETVIRPADPASLPDLHAIDARLSTVEDTNRKVRAAKQRAAVAEQLDELRAQSEGYTDQLAVMDRRKADALAAAKMPIDGLGFDEGGVTYRAPGTGHGIPFRQCSAAERLRVSLAMAMALNPRLRVIRITDGSLLDSDTMRLIEEMAGANGFQVWIERVDESGTVGIVIEDGEVQA